ELLKLPDCGHSPHRDQVEAVLQAAQTFINGLDMGETPGNGRYLEDYEEGEVIISRPYKISRREIMTYADAYDPQPIHIDENYARLGPFGSVIASGFQTISLAFRLFVETGYFDDGVSMGGPGMDEVRWLVPVYPGDVLTNHITVLEARRSKSKLDRGILRLGHDLRNQKGETCTTGSTLTIVRMRTTGGGVRASRSGGET
ncbi:MAG: MaoC family dehydratase, partial [Alphaproteobacteria bacterium]|nr:MaoC family dehydratase [Alphaproteobacteria bacterium]